MKKSILFLFILLPVLMFGQSSAFTIKGKLGNYNSPASIAISYVDQATGERFKEVRVLKNGGFFIKGYLKNPYMATLSFFPQGEGAKDVIYSDVTIWLEPGNMEINSPSSLQKLTIKNSKINNDYQAFNKALKPLLKKTEKYNESLSPDIFKNPESDEHKAYQKKIEEFKLGEINIRRQFIQTHPNSLISVPLLRFYADFRYGTKIDASDLQSLFNSFSPEVKNSFWGKAYQADLKKWKKVEVGSIAPDFTQNDPAGKPVKLSDYKGKYVLVDFWASWCHPCRDENPNLVKLYDLYKDKNFTILSISLDDESSKSAWLEAIKDDNLSWTQVSDLRRPNKACEKYGVGSIPDNFLIDPNGKVIAKSLRGDTLNTKLEQLFN